MNYAISGAYNTLSSTPFIVRVVSQYPILGAIAGSPESFDTNACKFNRIQIINVNSDPWELLWYTGVNSSESAAGILGFNTVDSGVGVLIAPVSNIIPGGVAIRAPYDYNLNNDPDYVILTIDIGDTNLDRLTSLDDGLDHKFCTLIFDNNSPETLHDLTGSNVSNVNGIDYLTGTTTKGPFYRPAGCVKPIKASDYDNPKKITFKPPRAKVASMTIMFTKFGFKNGKNPPIYNMEGREHLLIFELGSSDQRSQKE